MVIVTSTPANNGAMSERINSQPAFMKMQKLVLSVSNGCCPHYQNVTVGALSAPAWASKNPFLSKPNIPAVRLLGNLRICVL